eukprot:57765-Chlamydomonas_euryale.AAC.2
MDETHKRVDAPDVHACACVRWPARMRGRRGGRMDACANARTDAQMHLYVYACVFTAHMRRIGQHRPTHACTHAMLQACKHMVHVIRQLVASGSASGRACRPARWWQATVARRRTEWYASRPSGRSDEGIPTFPPDILAASLSPAGSATLHAARAVACDAAGAGRESTVCAWGSGSSASQRASDDRSPHLSNTPVYTPPPPTTRPLLFPHSPLGEIAAAAARATPAAYRRRARTSSATGTA